MDKFLECVKGMAKPTLQKWRKYLLVSGESFVQRFDRINSVESNLVVRERRGKLEFQSVDCCDEGVSFQNLSSRARSASARCFSLATKINPCEYDFMSAKYGTRFLDEVGAYVDDINRALLGRLFNLTFDAVTTQVITESDSQTGCGIQLTPKQDDVLTMHVGANAIGTAMLEQIMHNFRDSNGIIDEITLIVPSSVAYILQEAQHERNKYCCEKRTLDWGMDNLLAFTIEYNNIKFYVYPENLNFFTLPKDGSGHTFGVAFVKNRMTLHNVDYYKPILANNRNHTMLQDAFDDIIAISLEDRPSFTLVYAGFMAATKVNVIRSTHNAAVLLRFLDTEINNKTVSNNINYVDAPAFVDSVPTVKSVMSDDPYVNAINELNVVDVSANFADSPSTIKKTKS